MVNKHDAPRPTEAEIELLKILWDRGPCTVREVHEGLQGVIARPATPRR